MADAKEAPPSEDDATLLAVEATEPVILQEPDIFVTPTEDVAESAPRDAKAKPAKRASRLWPFLAGCAVVGAAGYGAVKYVVPQTGSSDAIAALQTQLAATTETDAKLQADIAALIARPAPDAALAARLDAVEASVAAVPGTADIATRVTALEDRLTAIEAASAGGVGAPAAALAAMDGQIKDLRAALEAQKGAGSAASADIEAASAAVQARLDASQAAAETAAKQAALSLVRAAFESGAPMAPALDGLTAQGIEVPAALAGVDGALPSIVSLQDGFAEPARAALSASIRANMGDGWASRLTSFLRTQSGARSLTPHEGTDADAVLSRAEGALRSGDIKTALTELEGLPAEGTAAMAQWTADANLRVQAEAAIADLSAAVNGK